LRSSQFRPLLRIRRDDDLDGSETPEGVFDRLQRICVAHLARCLDAPLGEAPDGDREPLLGLGDGAVDIRDVVPEARFSAGATITMSPSLAFARRQTASSTSGAGTRPVRDDEDAPLALISHLPFLSLAADSSRPSWRH